MTNDNSNIEDLIAKYLAGEADVEETSALLQWRASNNENEKYFETLERIFFESASLRNDITVDNDAAWNKLKKEIRKPKTENRSLKPQTANLKLLYRIAAIFVLAVLAATTYFFLQKENIQTINIASTNETKTVLLPDSSTVFLNKNSTVAYTFSKDKREIALTGEAFFDVKHDEKKPFIIHVNELEIKDVGTTFNVKAFSYSDSVEVIVESGEVEMTTALNESLIRVARVKPGQQAIFSKKAKRISKTTIKDTNALAYRTKVFVFENASLQAAVQKLTEVYGIEIILNDKIKNCHLTSTFKNEKIDAIMDVIATTLNLKLTKIDNKYSLEGEGCEE